MTSEQAMSAFVFSEDLEVEMKDTIKEIPLGELHPFPDHPFGVRDDPRKEKEHGRE